MPERKEENYFVGISDPVKVRKNILESSRSVIQSLHRFERFKTLRQKKIEQIHRLYAVMREIRSLVGRLKMELPKTAPQPKKKPSREVEKKQLPPDKKAKPQPSPQVKSELERLEEELGKVEKKLTELE